MLPSPAGSFLAIAIISSHVSGGFGTRSLRYHSSWTLVFNGTAYVLPFHVTESFGPASTSCSASVFSAPLSSRSQPASANSGVQIVSMLTMSMFLSPAASRRTISSRDASALLATGDCLMTYLPPDWLLHSLAALVFVPPGSKPPRKFRVTGPPLDPPHPAATMAHVPASRAAPTPMPLRLILLLSSRRPSPPPDACSKRGSRTMRHHVAALVSRASRVCPAVVCPLQQACHSGPCDRSVIA